MKSNILRNKVEWKFYANSELSHHHHRLCRRDQSSDAFFEVIFVSPQTLVMKQSELNLFIELCF
jgi:hypothetical protein